MILRPQSGQIGGYAGCDTLAGRYELSGNNLSFPGVASTMMACPQRMETEAAFLAALRGVKRWRIGGEQLELSTMRAACSPGSSGA